MPHKPHFLSGNTSLPVHKSIFSIIENSVFAQSYFNSGFEKRLNRCRCNFENQLLNVFQPSQIGDLKRSPIKDAELFPFVSTISRKFYTDF